MLSFWRKRSSIMVHFVFWPIIAVFVIWGFERYGNPVGGSAAVVNDHTISIQQYRNALQQIIDTYSRYMGGNFDEKMQAQFRVKEAAINQLVGMELISEQAARMGVDVTDAEVRDTITNVPFLQKEGRFSREYYEGFLHNRHQTPTQFETEVKKDLLREKTDRLFETQIRPSPLEVEKEKALRSVKMNVGFMVINKGELADKMVIPQNLVQENLKDAAHMAEVKKYYEVHRSEFTKPEEVKARHILIKAGKGKADQEKAAQEKLAKIQEELKTKSFEDVATKYSDDPGSKDKGGDLGWFARDSKVREFSTAAFSQEVGKVGAPIQTVFGFHIIKVEGKHPGMTPALDEVKEKIAAKLMAQEKIDKTLQEAEKKISTNGVEALKEIQDLSPTLKWEETGLFSSADDNIPKIGDSEDLVDAAYGLSEAKPISPKLIKVVGNQLYAMKLVKEEKVAPGDDQKVTDEIKKDYGRNAFEAWANSLRNQAKVSINQQLFAGEEAQSAGE